MYTYCVSINNAIILNIYYIYISNRLNIDSHVYNNFIEKNHNIQIINSQYCPFTFYTLFLNKKNIEYQIKFKKKKFAKNIGG